MSEPSGETLLPTGVEVSFADIEAALSGHSSDETKRAAGMALTATIVVAGLSRRKTRANEEPISPMPINATRSNNVSLIARP